MLSTEMDNPFHSNNLSSDGVFPKRTKIQYISAPPLLIPLNSPYDQDPIYHILAFLGCKLIFYKFFCLCATLTRPRLPLVLSDIICKNLHNIFSNTEGVNITESVWINLSNNMNPPKPMNIFLSQWRNVSS